MSTIETLENKIKELENKFEKFELYTKDLEFQLSAIKEENEYNFEPETPLPLDENENKKNKIEKVFNDKKKEVKKEIKKKVIEEINYDELINFVKEFFDNKDLKIKNLTSDGLYEHYENSNNYNELITKFKFRKELKPYLLRKGRYIIGFNENQEEIE
jgi:hypothetical protein